MSRIRKVGSIWQVYVHLQNMLQIDLKMNYRKWLKNI